MHFSFTEIFFQLCQLYIRQNPESTVVHGKIYLTSVDLDFSNIVYIMICVPTLCSATFFCRTCNLPPHKRQLFSVLNLPSCL